MVDIKNQDVTPEENDETTAPVAPEEGGGEGTDENGDNTDGGENNDGNDGEGSDENQA